ncbi:MAG: hypothetical protein Kow00114_35650 [Kiloniellaceae bacterium]
MRQAAGLRRGGVGNPIERRQAAVQTVPRMTLCGDGRVHGRDVGRERTMQRLRLLYYSFLVFTTALMVSAIANA